MADNQEALREWLRAEVAAAGHGVKSKLARYVGITADKLSRILSDEPGKETREIKAHELLKMQEFFGKSPASETSDFERVPFEEVWRETSDVDGEGYDRDHYVPAIPGAIPELDAKAGAGEGAVGEVMVIPVGNGTISAHKILDEWRIPPSYLREAVSNPDKAVILGVLGDSMMPNYAPGDKVLVDLNEHELRADGVYLISDGYSEPQIKRLQRIMFSLPPRCKIISDNPAYDPQEVDVDGVKILGRVAAYVGRR